MLSWGLHREAIEARGEYSPNLPQLNPKLSQLKPNLYPEPLGGPLTPAPFHWIGDDIAKSRQAYIGKLKSKNTTGGDEARALMVEDHNTTSPLTQLPTAMQYDTIQEVRSKAVPFSLKSAPRPTTYNDSHMINPKDFGIFPLKSKSTRYDF